MARRLLVAGATSRIAQETAKLLVARGDRLFLCGRDPARLEVVRADLAVRSGAAVAAAALDLDDVTRHEQLLDRAATALGGLDALLVAQGILAPRLPDATEADLAVLRTNLVGPVSLLSRAARRFEAQRSGLIVGISSVAGDRGRASNYPYGASKAGLSVYLQGLRNRLHPAGVRVLTVKPGFVDTPMTADVPKSFLFASPERVARGIVRAIDRRRDVVYVPWFWRPILLAVRALPEPVFKRLKL
jgi:short-subunit dehydrogenase